MHTAGSSISSPRKLSGDLCILGAGAAGITLARKLAKPGRKIVLIEGGGLEFSEESQSLYSGPIRLQDGGTGQTLCTIPYYLRTSRMRLFGGSTNHWANYCRPLDPIDFEVRPWVPHSGWPLTREELEPYYALAYPDCGISPIDEAELSELRGKSRPYPINRGEHIVTQMYHVGIPATNFAKKFGPGILDDPDVHLYTETNVLQLTTDRTRRRVTAVAAVTSKGIPIEVRADVFILATGGIENARLLMVNQNAFSEQFNRDLLGRFFMEHIHLDLGRVLLTDRSANEWDLYDYNVRKEQFGIFTLSRAAQAREKLLNVQADLDIREESPHPLTTGLRQWGDVLDVKEKVPPFYGRIRFIQEPSPNPKSRLRLSSEKDALGLPLASLDYQMAGLDWRTMRRFLELLAAELGSSFTGRVESFLKTASALPPEKFIKHFHLFGNHHIGTTRMHEDRSLGVVDPDLKAHGTENLYIAGSSVFPTAGHAAPTLTIVALAHRLAEHLDKTLPS